MFVEMDGFVVFSTAKRRELRFCKREKSKKKKSNFSFFSPFHLFFKAWSPPCSHGLGRPNADQGQASGPAERCVQVARGAPGALRGRELEGFLKFFWFQPKRSSFDGTSTTDAFFQLFLIWLTLLYFSPSLVSRFREWENAPLSTHTVPEEAQGARQEDCRPPGRSRGSSGVGAGAIECRCCSGNGAAARSCRCSRRGARGQAQGALREN